MKVLLITGSYPPMKCGVGSYTQRLAKALAELKDIKVTVLTDKRASEAGKRDSVEVLPAIRGWGTAELIRVVKHIRRLAPDIVHIQSPTMGYPVGRMPTLLPLLIRFIGRPCVQTWHEPLPDKSGLWLALGSDALITVREELITDISRLTQIALRNTIVSWIPAASLLPTVILNDNERSEIRNQYASEGEVFLVYYGFMAPLKGIEVLLEIVAKINARLVMACDFHPYDNYHSSLLTRISKMGIASRITITGFLPDEQLSNILASCDAVVLPFRDGWQPCNSTIDGAVAQGSFVLTTSLADCGYNKDKNIYFAKPGNVEEMIASIQKHAGCRIPPKPSTSQWRNIAEQHLNIYNQLVTR